jgi:AraC family transcriptional activator of tynA and feaB
MTPAPTASAAAPRGPLRFSTDAVRPAHRLSFWKDAICTAFVRLELDCDSRRPFHAALTARSMPRFDCISVSGSAQEVRRSARLVGEDLADSLILMRQLRGSCVAIQGENVLPLPEGGIVLLDSRRPYSLSFPGEFVQTVIKLPASAMEQRLGRGAVCSGRALPTACATSRLAGLAIDELARETRESVALPLSTIAFDLLALALAQSLPAMASPPPRMAAMRVAWAKAHALDNLRDAALDPEAVAARQGVSLRLLQRHFAAQGESLATFILEQRLQRCRDALQDPAQARRTITDIALSWGFGDSARFSRAFRQRFGRAPSDGRATAPH